MTGAVRATAMAASIGKTFGITREAAFDIILATAQKLEIRGTRFSPKTAGEIEAVIAQDMRAGSAAQINRPVIGA